MSRFTQILESQEPPDFAKLAYNEKLKTSLHQLILKYIGYKPLLPIIRYAEICLIHSVDTFDTQLLLAAIHEKRWRMLLDMRHEWTAGQFHFELLAVEDSLERILLLTLLVQSPENRQDDSTLVSIDFLSPAEIESMDDVFSPAWVSL